MCFSDYICVLKEKEERFCFLYHILTGSSLQSGCLASDDYILCGWVPACDAVSGCDFAAYDRRTGSVRSKNVHQFIGSIYDHMWKY